MQPALADTGHRERVPWRVNLGLTIMVLAVYTAFFCVKQWSVALAALFVIITPTAWGLVHEGIHGRLSSRPGESRGLSRLLCVLLGFSFDVVQFGHLTHHRYSGFDLDRPERINPARPPWVSWVRHYAHLVGGHYVFTCVAPIVAFAPARIRTLLLNKADTGGDPDMAAIRKSALKWFAGPERILRIRVDWMLALGVGVLMVLRFRGEWPVLLLALYGRALMYSVFDNLPHYGTHERGSDSAKNLRLAPWASFFVLNHNLHRAHHERPQIPWRALRGYASKCADGSYVMAGLRQFRGPVG